MRRWFLAVKCYSEMLKSWWNGLVSAIHFPCCCLRLQNPDASTALQKLLLGQCFSWRRAVHRCPLAALCWLGLQHEEDSWKSGILLCFTRHILCSCLLVMHITIFVAAMGKHAQMHEEVGPSEPLCLSPKILIAAALNLFTGNDPLLATSPDSSEYAY